MVQKAQALPQPRSQNSDFPKEVKRCRKEEEREDLKKRSEAIWKRKNRKGSRKKKMVKIWELGSFGFSKSEEGLQNRRGGWRLHFFQKAEEKRKRGSPFWGPWCPPPPKGKSSNGVFHLEGTFYLGFPRDSLRVGMRR